MESAVWALIAIAGAIGCGHRPGRRLIEFSFYLVALAGIGMLSTTGIIVAEDTFGPVADNAAGIAEMAGEFEGEAERIMVGLDAVGNTTKAVTKGFAIGSAVIAAVALFASFVRDDREQIRLRAPRPRRPVRTVINVADPKVFIGLILGGIGGLLVLLAGHPGRGPHRRHRGARGAAPVPRKPGIMDGTERPDYGPVIDICTAASLRELATPALLAVLMPVVVGFGLGPDRPGSLPGLGHRRRQPSWPTSCPTPVARGTTPRSTSRTAPRAARAPRPTRPPSSATPWATRSRTPAGPALNPLMKVMNLISLLVLPAVIALNPDSVLSELAGEDVSSSPLAWVVAGVALVVLLGAIMFSKRSGGADFAQPVEASEPAQGV